MKAVLIDFHTEMWKLGISNAVMHNEVAPGQHEISPIFALSNVSADQNALCQDVASKHGLTLLLDENLMRASMNLENIVTGVELGHWTKPSRAREDERRAAGFLSPSSRSWRTPLTFMVTPCALVSDTLGMITSCRHRTGRGLSFGGALEKNVVAGAFLKFALLL